MKRSEAVLKIAECLIEPRSEDVMIEASHILDRLEKIGMLPPTITHNFYNSILTPPTQNPSGTLDYSWHKENKWEKE